VLTPVGKAFFSAADDGRGAEIESKLREEHARGPKMVRNKWGALKANMKEVVTAEKSRDDLAEILGGGQQGSPGGGADATRDATRDAASSALAARPRSSFSDSRFAKGKGGAGGKGAAQGKRGSAASAAQQARMNNARKMAMNRASSMRTRVPTAQDQANVSRQGSVKMRTPQQRMSLRGLSDREQGS
jgi:hypothetical protein